MSASGTAEEMSLEQIDRQLLVKKTTLDAVHNQRVDYFKSLRQQLPVLRSKASAVESELRRHEELAEEPPKAGDAGLDQAYFRKKFELKSRLSDLHNQIRDIENAVQENEYYLKVGTLLMEYYDILQQDAEGARLGSPHIPETKDQQDQPPIGIKGKS
ncbi:MAG: hypothetical protein ACYCOU_04505 [Sulfobacillus sp.]